MSTYEHHNGQDYHPANDTRTPWPDYRPAGGFFALACELATMREGDPEKVLASQSKPCGDVKNAASNRPSPTPKGGR